METDKSSFARNTFHCARQVLHGTSKETATWLYAGGAPPAARKPECPRHCHSYVVGSCSFKDVPLSKANRLRTKANPSLFGDLGSFLCCCKSGITIYLTVLTAKEP